MEQAIAKIPLHLKRYIVDQEYDQYSAIDHACWRYIMKISKAFFVDNAHPTYLDGLEKTGISTERIPRISEMDEKLKKFGWRAVPITGFIPPAAFLEMLSLGILPIACDMRKMEHLDYTPAPDIVHEAAGHAPILADPGYASFLHKFGEVARKVIFAKHDCEVYEAVLELSETKENPHCTGADIHKAEERLSQAYGKTKYVSEAQQLTRIGWWSIEYGLIEKPEGYLIYGAGLLSSVGESYSCLGDQVKKVPFTLDCIQQDYDITQPQPQLFYSKNFHEMEAVIDQFADTLAYRHGGLKALDKAIEAETVNTVVLESGLQIGGELKSYRKSSSGEEAIYLHFAGPTQLSWNDKQIENHGPSYHKEGFGTPLGKIKFLNKESYQIQEADLVAMGFEGSSKAKLEFESGVVLEGVFVGLLQIEGKTLVLSFEDCRVRYQEEVLFDPSWGTFDMACGSSITSVFGGAADREAYLNEVGETHNLARAQKRNLGDHNSALNPLYHRIREIREQGLNLSSVAGELESIFKQLQNDFSQDWLLRFELAELIQGQAGFESWFSNLKKDLELLARKSGDMESAILRGLELLNRNSGLH